MSHVYYISMSILHFTLLTQRNTWNEHGQYTSTLCSNSGVLLNGTMVFTMVRILSDNYQFQLVTILDSSDNGTRFVIISDNFCKNFPSTRMTSNRLYLCADDGIPLAKHNWININIPTPCCNNKKISLFHRGKCPCSAFSLLLQYHRCMFNLEN